MHNNNVIEQNIMYPCLIFCPLKNLIADTIQPKKVDNYIPYLSFVNLNKIIFPWVNKTNKMFVFFTFLCWMN